MLHTYLFEYLWSKGLYNKKNIRMPMKIKDCIFCKICMEKAPSYTVYEDDMVKAFFDIYPASEGHTLVVPKKH